jgi:tRNA(Ile)-lysidine synthetase-like protein
MAAALAAVRDEEYGNAQSGGACAGQLAPFSLHALHINHNIRPACEGAADEEAVKALCEKLSVPLTIRRLRPAADGRPGAVEAFARKRRCGIEAAARHFRHALLQKEARRLGAQAILVAHTRDDVLEAVLMAVLRGAGPAGLGGMLKAGGFAAGSFATDGGLPRGIPLVRPILDAGRNEVLACLEERGLSYREDPSNADTRFLRNKVRRVLIPFLDAQFPGWKKPLLALGRSQARAAEFLTAEAGRRLPWKEEGGALSVDAALFYGEAETLREEALFAALDRLSGASAGPAGGASGGRILRRAALRAFIEGGTAACDLGYCPGRTGRKRLRAEKREGRVVVSAVPAKAFVTGFSALLGEAELNKTAAACKLGLRNSAIDNSAVFPVVVRKQGKTTEIRDKEGKTWTIGKR